MKGIVLAGGAGTRLHPITLGISKQLAPIYDKPMIYYPLSVLMLAHIRDILIISTPSDTPLFQHLLGDGSQFGANFTYAIQEQPNGIAEAFLIGKDFIGDDSVCLILGDNIFYGNGLQGKLNNARKHAEENGEASIFVTQVKDPQRYGIAEFDAEGKCISVEEKPSQPKSNFAITGLYFYPNSVISVAQGIKPSTRGELEITSVNEEYLNRENLRVEQMGRGFAWLDTGTHASLLEASNFVAALQSRQGIFIACLEEIALKNKWITKAQLRETAKAFGKNAYGEYLLNLV